MSEQPVSSSEPSVHRSVLVAEIVAGLAVHPGGNYIDGTVGLAGHAEAILQASSPSGRLLGIDADPDAVVQSRCRLCRFGDRAVVVQGNFRELRRIADEYAVGAVDGILFDLGVSSYQLATTGRGFSFQHDAPLDMRMDPAISQTAADLVNQLDEVELTRILRDYGEESHARRIARAIVRSRPLRTTHELAAVVLSVIGRRGLRIHPATKTFQALRIAVNQELDSLDAGLTASLELLQPGGRLAVLSFHSLEDRIVKNFLRGESHDCVCPPWLPVCVCAHRARLRLMNPAVQTPSAAELMANRRSRSAKLRLAERI